jgi:hypothetical protein
VYAIALSLSITFFPLASAVASASSGIGAEGQSALNPAQMNEQARHQLDLALKLNGLVGPNINPWHLKAEFKMSLNFPEGPKSFNGSMEEWFEGQYSWRRKYKGERPTWNGSEWGVSKVERYAKKEQQAELADYSLMSNIVRPLIDPLFQIANIKPTDGLIARKIEIENLALNCISYSEKSASEHGKWPEWLVPLMCFDDQSHLRLIRSGDTLLHFDDIQMFQGRAIARNIVDTFKGAPVAEIKLSLLEEVVSVDEAFLKPPADATFRPYVIERGFPKPVSVYEVGAHSPPMPNGQPFSGTFLVPVFIKKDGTVKLQRDVSVDGPVGDVFKAMYKAVAKWKFQPYLVDGQPVEVDYDVPYETDGKPYVPSYQREPASSDNVAGGHPGF